MVARFCSGPKSYVVVLDDGRVWKRHLDDIRRDSMDSAVPQPNVTREPQDSALDPPSHVPLGTDVPLSPQVPPDIPVMYPAQSSTQVPSEKEESVPVGEKDAYSRYPILQSGSDSTSSI